MTRSGAYIRDVHLLDELNEQIGRSGEAMSTIDMNVGNYINGVRDTLRSQLDYIQMKLGEAKSSLSSAENALSICRSSQAAAAVVGLPAPSCVLEECAVDAARAEVAKWSMRYEQGQRIMGECQQEIAGYNAGGHVLIRTMCEQQTPLASQTLMERKGQLQDILNSEVVASPMNGSSDMSKEPLRSPSEGNRNNALKKRFKL